MTILLLLMDAKTSRRVEMLAKTCSSRTSYLKSVFKRLTLGKKTTSFPNLVQHCCSEYTWHWPFLNPTKVQVSLHNAFTCTSPKTNMDTQNGGLEKMDSSRIWPFLVYMLDFRGVYSRDTYDINTSKSFVFNHFC